MIPVQLDALLDEVTKIATSKGTFAAKAEAHFSADEKNWAKFVENLKSPAFQKAVLNHPNADDKLHAYVKNFGGLLRSKKEIAKVQGSTGNVYSIRKLPDGRLGCTCGDWQYKHSVRGGDCKHILNLPKEKRSSLETHMIPNNLAAEFEKLADVGRFKLEGSPQQRAAANGVKAPSKAPQLTGMAKLKALSGQPIDKFAVGARGLLTKLSAKNKEKESPSVGQGAAVGGGVGAVGGGVGAVGGGIGGGVRYHKELKPVTDSALNFIANQRKRVPDSLHHLFDEGVKSVKREHRSAVGKGALRGGLIGAAMGSAAGAGINWMEKKNKHASVFHPAVDMAGLGILAVPSVKELRSKKTSPEEKSKAKYELAGLGTLGGVSAHSLYKDKAHIGAKLRSAGSQIKGAFKKVI